MHRSGTTWVGKMLAAGGEIAYLHEPLNPNIAGPLLSLKSGSPYRFICRENEAEFLEPLQRLAALEYPLAREVRSVRSLRDVGRVGRRAARTRQASIRGLRPLFKDPFAVFSIEWFHERLACQVVAVVRHPAAVVSSLERLRWPFDVSYLLGQPQLMEHWFGEFADEMNEIARRPVTDVVSHCSLLWKLIYAVVQKSRAICPEMVVVRHEDLSRNPLEQYANLYASVGLSWSSQAEKAIFASSSAANPEEAPIANPHAVRLDSRATVENWRRRLSREDAKRIRELTEQVARHFYPEPEWW
jgi:hypothetical protein